MKRHHRPVLPPAPSRVIVLVVAGQPAGGVPRGPWHDQRTDCVVVTGDAHGVMLTRHNAQ